MTTTNAAGAATATAQPTGTETNTAPKIPGRSEVLMAIAKEAMGEPGPTAPPANAEAEIAAENVLSQPEPEATEETVTTEATEPETEEPGENHLEDDLRASLPDEVQEAINRRIGKEVAKTKAEREQREGLETRIAELEERLNQAPKSKTQEPVQLSEVHDVNGLESKKLEMEQAMEDIDGLLFDLEDSPEKVEQALRANKVQLKDATGEDDFTPERMKGFLNAMRRNADRNLRIGVPKREKFLREAEGFAAKAVELMPELKDMKSERTKLFHQIIREMPEIRREPNWPLRVVAGVKAMEWIKETLEAQAAAKTTATPKKPREVPVTIPAPRAAAPRTTMKAPQGEDANTVADKVLSGDKSARLNVIRGLIPKMK